MRVSVRATPNATDSAVEGWALTPDGRAYLRVRLATAQVDAEVNEALITLLAKGLKVPVSSVQMVGGPAARIKLLDVAGLELAALEAAFGARPKGF